MSEHPRIRQPPAPWDDDEAFLGGFEDASLPAEEFGHVGHLRLGYLLLQRHSFSEALNRARSGLVNFATAKTGGSDKYNETVTAFYLFLIRCRMEAMSEGPLYPRWDEFLRSHPDLLSRGIEAEYFREGSLDSAQARDGIVFQRLGE